MIKNYDKGEYCLELAATTTIFLSLVFSVHWNVIDKNDLNEVQIVFALHWGHFWGQCTLNTRLKKIAVVAAKSKQYSPLWIKAFMKKDLMRNVWYDDLDIIVTSYGKQCLLETTDNEFKIASAMWAIETNTAKCAQFN